MKFSGLKLCVLFVIAAFCVGFVSCASFTFAGSVACHVPEDFFGISPDRSPLNPEDYRLLDEFNAVWIRTTIRWSSVEREQGVWTFDHWDNYLERAETAGKKVIFILAFDNGWLFPNGQERRRIRGDELPLFLNYVEQVVSRYGTRVVYEIWNEPNGWFWKGTNREFFTLSAAAARRIREVEPDAVILGGSTFRVSRSFTRGMFNSGAMEGVDGFSVHPYATTPRATIEQHNMLMSTLAEFNHTAPVWVTEVGYFTGPRPFFSTNRYAEDIVKTLSSLAARANEIRNIIWYELMDDYNPGEVKNPLYPLHYLGLIYPNGTYKPGAEAFMLTANYLAGSEYRPELPLREGVPRNITSLYFVKEDGTNILILWNDGAGRRRLRLSVPNAADLSRHNIHNREITPLSEDIVLDVRSEPIFITWNGSEPPRLINN